MQQPDSPTKTRIENGVVYSPFPPCDIPKCSFYAIASDQLKTSPEKIMLVDDSRALTRAECLTQMQRYAAGFQAHGIQPGDHVCLHLDNSIDNCVAMLLNRSGRLQPQPPQLETPTVPSAPPRSEDTAEDEIDTDWDPLQMLVDVAAEAVPEKHTSTVVSSTEGDWRRQCGFLGFESLKSSEHTLQDLCGVTMTVFSLLLSLTPATRYRKSDISAEDKFTLFPMKLKLGISFTALVALFSVHKTTASRTFKALLDILSVRLERWVFVPARDIIKESLPPAFKTHYPGCTFIIDCTEIRTETPSDPEQQHYMYSSYKSGHTIKLLIGIISNGMISFVSKIYGGRHSDSHITVNSGFLSLVQPGDVVLSDKGFPSIRTTMAEKGAVLVMPPFSVGGQQLFQEDMDNTFHIAQVRIHV
ncbi:uncharacterized protein ISCGN_011677 [Ixodes scapularis]